MECDRRRDIEQNPRTYLSTQSEYCKSDMYLLQRRDWFNDILVFPHNSILRSSRQAKILVTDLSPVKGICWRLVS